MSRKVGHVLGFAIGYRDREHLKLAWSDVPKDYLGKPVATDHLEAYARFFPTAQHLPCDKGSGGTSIVEANNTCWRHRHPGLTRKSCGVHRRILDDLIDRFYIVAENQARTRVKRYKQKLKMQKDQ